MCFVILKYLFLIQHMFPYYKWYTISSNPNQYPSDHFPSNSILIRSVHIKLNFYPFSSHMNQFPPEQFPSESFPTRSVPIRIISCSNQLSPKWFTSALIIIRSFPINLFPSESIPIQSVPILSSFYDILKFIKVFT